MTKTTLIAIQVPDRPGSVAATVSVLADAGISILSVLGWAAQGVIQLEVDRPAEAIEALERHGVPYRKLTGDYVELADRPGALRDFLAELAEKGVNLHSLCGSGARLIWTGES